MDYRNGHIPHDHTLAAHWEMLVTGNERAYILALVGGAEVVDFTIERDDDTILGLYKECKRFRENYLAGSEEPEPDASPETARAFAARVSYEEGAEILFDGKVAEAAIRLTEIEAERKPLDEEEAQLKNVVRQAMATAKVGRAPNGVEWAWTEGKVRQLRKRGVKA
jgi:predicted phage-related endonuclease